MVEPLSSLKADVFKTPAHAARIRILELPATGDRAVTELLPAAGLEALNLSEQLGVLRREGVVVGRRHANTVTQSSASPHIAERLAVSRTVLSGLQSDQVSALERSATDT